MSDACCVATRAPTGRHRQAERPRRASACLPTQRQGALDNHVSTGDWWAPRAKGHHAYPSALEGRCSSATPGVHSDHIEGLMTDTAREALASPNVH